MSSNENKRVIFVDVLRLIALAQMVNGHTLHALLQPDVRHGAFYQGYLWFRGLVSVAFMLVAGLAFHITVLARLQQHRADPAAVRRRVLRALEIIAIGLLLRLPLQSLLAFDLTALERGLHDLSRVDVLPCIGVSLLALEALVWIFPRPRQVIAACAVLAGSCALLAPRGATLPAHGAIAFVTGWLGPQGGSQFPLLPYAGYVFAGVVVGRFALPAGGRTAAALPAPRLLAAGALLLALGLLTARIPWTLVHAGTLAQAPSFLVQKLAAVTLAIGGLAFALQRTPRLPRPLQILSGETLALYVAHLLVLYGQPINLHGRLGESLSLASALAFSCGMLLAMTGFGLAWHRLKAWRPAQRALPSERVTVLACAAVLLLTSLAAAAHALAGPQVNTNGTRYAIGGFDPVAYFEQHAPARGKPELAASYEGATWLFASEAHKRAFKADPAKYAPAYGGHCAYAAAQGQLVTIDPNAWSIVGGRLYLNYSLEVREKWNADQARFIRDADAFWAKLTASKKTSRAEVRSVGLTVANLDEAERFFVDVLGFRRDDRRSALSGPELDGLLGIAGAHATTARLALGSEHIELTAYSQPLGRSVPADSRSNDLWFQHLALVTSDLDALSAKVTSHGALAISHGAQTIPASNPAAGGIRAFYFRGPSAHPLELIWYPRDKGQARWHATRRPLLGIDHTAIAVTDSDRSRAFYSDLLGLAVAGHSFNFGREQEALSAVPGARVRITGLRGEHGPGVEFLQYEAPRDGRPAPADARASDLWSGEITIAVADLDRTVSALHAAGARFVSDRVRDTRAIVPGSQRGVIVRDPDGHAVRVVQ